MTALPIPLPVSVWCAKSRARADHCEPRQTGIRWQVNHTLANHAPGNDTSFKGRQKFVGTFRDRFTTVARETLQLRQ